VRLAHVSATFPPYWAGTGNVAYHNARLLYERGHAVTVFTAGEGGDMGFPFEVVRLPELLRLGNAPFTPALVGKLRGFDLIHLHYPYIFGAELSALAARLYRTPMVLTYHNRLEESHRLKRALFQGYNLGVEPLVLRTARRLLAVRREHLSTLYPHLGSDPRLQELPNGVDAGLFTPGDRLEARRRYGVSDDAPLALFVGALDQAHRFKNVDGLIRAFARVPLPEARLWIVGDGGLRPELEALARRLGLGERVQFLGKHPPSALPPLFRAADVSVLPSTGVESFGLVLLESMACGTPVIAAALPGVRTLVEEGVDGHLAAVGDEADLARLLELRLRGRDQAEAMGRKAREKVLREYDWGVIAGRLEETYRSVLREAGARSAAL